MSDYRFIQTGSSPGHFRVSRWNGLSNHASIKNFSHLFFPSQLCINHILCLKLVWGRIGEVVTPSVMFHSKILQNFAHFRYKMDKILEYLSASGRNIIQVLRGCQKMWKIIHSIFFKSHPSPSNLLKLSLNRQTLFTTLASCLGTISSPISQIIRNSVRLRGWSQWSNMYNYMSRRVFNFSLQKFSHNLDYTKYR